MKKPVYEKLVIFLLGVFMAISAMFLIGAAPRSEIGRYQIQSWVRDNFLGVFVVDTATGVVKYVDRAQENKPFENIK